MGTTEFVAAGLLPEIADDLHVSVARAGLSITVFAVGMILGAPLVSLLTLRLSKRRTLIVALGIFAAGHVLAAVASSFAVLVAARFLSALATGAFWAVANVVAAHAAGASSSSRAVGVVGSGAMLANVVGVPLVIAMSRHPERQALAELYGATDIVEERGEEGVERIRSLTNGLGAHSVIEAVGTQESTMQAIGATRPNGHMGFVGVNYEVAIPGMPLFFAGIHTHGGPAPVRRFLPNLSELIWNREIEPGKVFDLTLALHQAAEGYKAMDERRATKVLLTI